MYHCSKRITACGKRLPASACIVLLWYLCYAGPAILYAQGDTIPLPNGAKWKVATWSAGLHYGSVFAHSEAVQNTAGANPRGVELSYTIQRRDSGVVNLCNCYPRQGAVVSFFDFDNAILGRGVMAGWQLEPTYRLGKKLQLGVRGVAGLAWMSNPFDSVKNPGNQSYSTAVSAWLLVGLGISYPLGERWRVQLSGNFQHTSNGGMRQPNKGVNWPTAGLHLQYMPEPLPFYTGRRANEKTWKGKPWRKDLVVFGTGKRAVNADGVGTRMPIIGLAGTGSKQVSHTNALTLGVEGYYDGFSKNRMETDTVGMHSAVRAGIMGGHEFLLGRFIFSQQVGVYVYKPAPYDRAWFHRWGLMYRAGKHWYAGINLKAHLQVADFIDLRVAYAFR